MVEAVIALPERGARSVVVRDGAGNEVPALTTPTAYHPDGTVSEVRVQFRARRCPGLGYSSYDVERSGQAPADWVPVEGLSVIQRTVRGRG